MPLTLAAVGEVNKIKRISGNDDTRRFLSSMGFVTNEDIIVISDIGGNMIIKVKETRVALDKNMAKRIFI
ncbi:MAG: FeoA family protein [Inconstantimicrobium porci]|uniref:Ferrous iron transport protein A n=1 Tax=Inconstantimicrobium porci TaxID=2652291 RepID=A0A7X2N1T0_9CLOT|nr:FeoA family protein [Inconstantimicrobium porci]MDD6772169.1 FeoA family protein [Inconstantimicrobium porci]MDY5910545.1 FeoA family protein [Inconstantimicrobium porci]MSR92705.1 ferrous iron transport protein A [Inconstantimicrobium porci]